MHSSQLPQLEIVLVTLVLWIWRAESCLIPQRSAKGAEKRRVPLLSIACNVQYTYCATWSYLPVMIMSCLVSRWEPSLWLDIMSCDLMDYRCSLRWHLVPTSGAPMPNGRMDDLEARVRHSQTACIGTMYSRIVGTHGLYPCQIRQWFKIQKAFHAKNASKPQVLWIF